MPSTAFTPTYDGPRGSGRSSPPSDPRSGWRARLRRRPWVGPCFRGSVFAAGLVLVLAGGSAWLFSTLLTLPLVLAGLWIWSHEFRWGHRLFRAFLRYARGLWDRCRARPVRWTALTVLGLAFGGGVAWAAAHFDVLGRVLAAVGL